MTLPVGDMDGYIDAMEQFVPQPPDAGVVAQYPVATACGGGMLECPPFADADGQSTQALLDYLNQATEGCHAYASIAQACAADYRNADGRSAQAIAAAVNSGPHPQGIA